MANRYEMLRKKYMKEEGGISKVIGMGASAFKYLGKIEARARISKFFKYINPFSHGPMQQFRNAAHSFDDAKAYSNIAWLGDIHKSAGNMHLKGGLMQYGAQAAAAATTGYAGGSIYSLLTNNEDNIPTEESTKEVMGKVIFTANNPEAQSVVTAPEAAPEVVASSTSLGSEKLVNMIAKFNVVGAREIVQKNSQITEESLDNLYKSYEKDFGDDPGFKQVKDAYLNFKQVFSEEIALDATARLYINVFLAGVLLIIGGVIVNKVMPKAAYECVSYVQYKKNRYMTENTGANTGILGYIVNAIVSFFKWIIGTNGNVAISLGILLCMSSAGLLFHQYLESGNIGPLTQYV